MIDRYSTPTEGLLQAFRESGYEPKQSGEGWISRCPAHRDSNPSLSISQGNDGRALVHCHAGCKPTDVVAAVGLTMRDLMPEFGALKPSRRSVSAGRVTSSSVYETGSDASGRGGSVDVDAGVNVVTRFATAREAVAELERRHGFRSALWTYRDAAGEPVGVVVRWDRADSKKDIRPVSLNGSGWAIGGMPSLRPLYGLPELAAASEGSTMYVAEGEKAADAVSACGLIGTTSPHGSNSAAKADWSPLAGHDVVILPDHDDAGERYAEDVARLAAKAGARSIRVVRLADRWDALPDGGDAADVLELEGGDAGPVRLGLESLVAHAETDTTAADRNEAPVFDLAEMFPPNAAFARDYFADLARSTQTPVEMAALLGLATASACICNVVRVRGHGDHTEPAPIWALVLSESATRKSSVLGELLRPIAAWESAQAHELAPKIAVARQRGKMDEARLRHLEGQAAKERDESKRARLVADAAQLAKDIEAEPLPAVPRLLACEPTPEALVRQMADNGGRALLSSAEGDALDIIQGRYSGSRNYGAMLKGHAGDPIRAQRIGRPSDVIDCPALAVALCIQRAAVEEIWLDPQAHGRGLLARFAVIAPADLVGSRDVRPDPVNPKHRDTWHSAVRRLLDFSPSADVDEEPMVIGLDCKADAVYHELQLRVERELGPSGDLCENRAWGGKLCGLALRMALTLHALGSWAHSGSPENAGSINAETMRAAIRWADYLAAAERHARLHITSTSEAREQTQLLNWIEGRRGSVTVRELTQGMRRFRGKTNEARGALAELVAAGFGKWELAARGSKGGRPPQRFEMHSRSVTASTVYETPPSSPKSVGSVDADSLDNPADDEWGTL